MRSGDPRGPLEQWTASRQGGRLCATASNIVFETSSLDESYADLLSEFTVEEFDGQLIVRAIVIDSKGGINRVFNEVYSRLRHCDLEMKRMWCWG